MFEILPLEPGDISRLQQIEQSAHLSPWSEKIMKTSFNKRSHNYGLIRQGEVLGYYFSEFIAGEMNLHNICIGKKHQGQGLAKQLMLHLLAKAQELNAEELWLEVRESNHSAITLYQQFGFEQVGQRKNYYPIKDSNQRETALLMKKVL